MEDYKQKEKEHYDALAKEWREQTANTKNLSATDIETIDVMKMPSYQYLYRLLGEYVKGKSVLDYGCGHGMHAVALADRGAREVVGIDLSEESLAIARERAHKAGYDSRITFKSIDAEHLEFPDGRFDVVFDGGTFSSIDVTKALPEIERVLAPGGVLIGIETLGHHPLANLKRWLNRKRGTRTTWAANHIMKMRDLRLAKTYFTPEKLFFFHFISLITIPFARFPGGSLLVRIGEGIDTILFALFPFLKRYAFKIVFVFKKTK